MKLLVGLGNPGDKYRNTRHNIGFKIIDAFGSKHDFSSPKAKFHGLISEGMVGHHKVITLKPQTFMNRSGVSVSELAGFYKIAPEDIIVVHDEIDLQFARVKAKQGGGNAGHNGLKDISARIGPDYYRFRFGVGHPGDRNKVASYVLKDFTKDEHQQLERFIEASVGALPALLQGNVTE
ncbi:MAG: aminoacyl-tRNA hydrolase, partial [Rickettsiales bacterium]|nr:aminoacyl-tRNA hydrolase [Rickettsiales bacterium]